MKKAKQLFLTALGIFLFSCATAQVNPNSTYVSGYTRSDGTFVQGYYKTIANSTNRDNYTTKPNTNPYTGSIGYVAPDNKPASSTYSIPSTSSNVSSSYSTPVQTGSRGGQYYINSNGNKTYIKRD